MSLMFVCGANKTLGAMLSGDPRNENPVPSGLPQMLFARRNSLCGRRCAVVSSLHRTAKLKYFKAPERYDAGSPARRRVSKSMNKPVQKCSAVTTTVAPCDRLPTE